MQQLINKCLWVVLLAVGLQTSWGFALLGPLVPPNGADAWQTPVIGYRIAGDVGTPRDIGQGYRPNVPTNYYTFDASFLDFFGSNGVVAVESAMATMNALPKAEQVDPTQYPFDSQNYNPTAMGLYMYDVKSTTLALMMEQMGLAQPERYTWTLQDRFTGPVCPLDFEYLVIQRNFADTNTALNQIQYSSYVNNVLYTYSIEENCTGPDPLAFTIPQAFDTEADQYTAVAAGPLGFFGGLQYGGFYNGLTADDVAGIKYLLTTNNINREMVTGSLLLTATTNYAGGEQLFPVNPNIVPTFPNTIGYGTFDLGSLLTFSTTNSPAVVAATFPGVVVANSLNYFVTVTNATVITYYTNYIGSPVGSPPILKYATNYSYPYQERYVTTFANIQTNYLLPNSPAILQTITTGPQTGAPYGSPAISTTNYTRVTLTNWPSGSYYVIPNFGTNLCPVGILYTLQTNVVYTTNSLTLTSTNAATATNVVTTTNAPVYSYTQNLITWYTNYIYVTYTVNCAQTADPVDLYQGIGGVQFVRRDYDSLLGQFFEPVSYNYTMVAVTNSQYVTRQFSRTVAAPEIVVEAGDYNDLIYAYRSVDFDPSQALPGLAGPGVINHQAVFQFNTDVNAFFNAWPLGLDGYIFPNEETQEVPPYLTWASFDGTTNDPVLYPSGQSIANLASQILIQISPTSLAEGTNGAPYSAQFTVVSQTRLTPPFQWSAAGLPPGLTMSAAGLLSGTPIDQTGGANSPLVYDVTITLTDSLLNAVDWFYSITIQ